MGKTKGEDDTGASPIRQIYTYMCASGSTYGILSTYQRTWFLRRSIVVEDGVEKSLLQFSQPLLPTSSGPTLAQAIVYITWLALQSRVLLKVPVSAEAYLEKIKTANAEAIAMARKKRKDGKQGISDSTNSATQSSVVQEHTGTACDFASAGR